MENITVDFKKTTGIIKPMHAVNNGPVYKFYSDQRITNIDAYRDAGIPYARTHDASFYATYGGEHTVDVNAIFPDFDADPYDEESYDFTLTDEYLRVIEFAGTKIFYRLGSKIEHWQKKYNTLPPKDFHKWAVICEHIIKHFNCGWADGFNMNIEYWEIWNEPDLDDDDSDNKHNWGGTKLQFFELYDIAAKHLKKCFPNLKIGGPALAYRMDWADEFLSQLKAPLDFFSWHVYTADPAYIAERARTVRKMLDEYGFENTESILNEWNYVRSFQGDDWIYSLRAEKKLKGAAFTAAAMCVCQKESVDMLMYYDARPCSMNGMFNTDIVCDILKGYYPFKMFNELYKLKNEVYSADGGDIYACAAGSGSENAVLLTYFNDDDSSPVKNVRINLLNCGGAAIKLYILDSNHDMELICEKRLDGDVYELEMKLFDTYLIKVLP